MNNTMCTNYFYLSDSAFIILLRNKGDSLCLLCRSKQDPKGKNLGSKTSKRRFLPKIGSSLRSLVSIIV